MHIELLKKLGFSDKTALTYLELLRLGPTSVRKLAEKVDMNRGVVYEALKTLREQGLVNFYEKDAKQFFVAEDPSRLQDLVTRQSEKLKEADKKLQAIIPELKSVYYKGGERPVSRYYSQTEIHLILEDVLTVVERSEEKLYRIYSVAGIRECLYDDFPSFSDARVVKGIKVKAIAIGAGGVLRGLDERKWLNLPIDKPTYIIMYSGKTAYISLDAKDEPIGVVIENEGIYKMQQEIFDELWKKI